MEQWMNRSGHVQFTNRMYLTCRHCHRWLIFCQKLEWTWLYTTWNRGVGVVKKLRYGVFPVNANFVFHMMLWSSSLIISAYHLIVQTWHAPLDRAEIQEAYNMVKSFEPTTPQEYIVKAVSCASLGQDMDNAELLKQAQQYFQVVGASASECDTIPGRQCMASCHFLLKQFDDALIYLKVQPLLLH